jgi:hypothetical protein
LSFLFYFISFYFIKNLLQWILVNWGSHLFGENPGEQKPFQPFMCNFVYLGQPLNWVKVLQSRCVPINRNPLYLHTGSMLNLSDTPSKSAVFIIDYLHTVCTYVGMCTIYFYGKFRIPSFLVIAIKTRQLKKFFARPPCYLFYILQNESIYIKAKPSDFLTLCACC